MDFDPRKEQKSMNMTESDLLYIHSLLLEKRDKILKARFQSGRLSAAEFEKDLGEANAILERLQDDLFDIRH